MINRTCWQAIGAVALCIGAVAVAADSTPLFAPLSDQTSLELPTLDPAVPAPQEFLGYPIGKRFTHYERILSYLDALAAASDRVSTWEIGRTYEDRPLRLVAISSPENIARLAEIQEQRALLGTATPLNATERDSWIDHSPVVVWLGFGVHGNESSSAEAAMAAAYVLAAAGGDWTDLLDDVVVLIDPLTNPDGRERYVHFYETQQGARPDPFAESAEHWEPWPGGRQNHYLIDLNRDWAWATQVETQRRLTAYRQWEPQVYVDFHEMFNDSTYFFPPSAEPIHPQISSRTIEWLKAFGAANAAAFDRLGWIYYSAERFDLFYPGYGDSYPSLSGAVGMTYEVAGHGAAGAALRRRDGSLLTLSDRAARHFTAALTTVRTAAEHRAELLRDTLDRRDALLKAPATTYLWATDAPEGRAAVELLRAHSVEVRQLAEETSLAVRDLLLGETVNRTLPAGAVAVSTRQPLGAFLRALMEIDAAMPEAFVEEQRRLLELNRRTEFFDVTSWALPLAFNLEVSAFDGPIAGTEPLDVAPGSLTGVGEIGYLAAPRGLATYRLAARLQEQDITYRVAIASFDNAGTAFPAGTLFVPRRGNPADLDATMGTLAAATGLDVYRVASGYAEGGISLGSDFVVPVRPARIGLVGGTGISPTSFGSIWHLLDRQIGVLAHRLDLRYLDEIELKAFDVIVLPSAASLDRQITDERRKALDAWIRGGGVLIAVGPAVDWLQKHDLTEIERWQGNGDESDLPAGRELSTPGATLATALQPRHPLAAGLAAPPPTLFAGTRILLPTDDPRTDVLTVRQEDPVLAGFAWPEARDRLAGALLVGVEERGAGAVVVFSQEPVFRLFWRGTAPLFLNAAMFGPSLREGRDM